MRTSWSNENEVSLLGLHKQTKNTQEKQNGRKDAQLTKANALN